MKAKKGLRSKVKYFFPIFKRIPIDGSNMEIVQGYLLRIDTSDGHSLGEVGVSNQYRVYHAFAINTTEDDIDLEIFPKEVIPFDFCKFPDEEFSDSETGEFKGDFENFYFKRFGRINGTLYVSHLTPEGKEYISRLCK